MGETSDINVIQSWIHELNPNNHTLTEKWTTGDSHRLVYDTGGPQPLEVHNAFFVELDGRPMQVPACVVMSGNTDFEFFDDKAGLFAFLGPREGVKPPGKTTSNTNFIQNITAIVNWVEQRFRDIKASNSTFKWEKKSQLARYVIFHVSANGDIAKQLKITKADAGRLKAQFSFDNGAMQDFRNENELGVLIDTMLQIDTSEDNDKALYNEPDDNRNTKEIKKWVETCNRRNSGTNCRQLTSNDEITRLIGTDGFYGMYPGHLYYNITNQGTSMTYEIVPMSTISDGDIINHTTDHMDTFKNENEFKTLWIKLLTQRSTKGTTTQVTQEEIKLIVEASKSQFKRATFKEIENNSELTTLLGKDTQMDAKYVYYKIGSANLTVKITPVKFQNLKTNETISFKNKDEFSMLWLMFLMKSL